jgi:hypothetical protein
MTENLARVEILVRIVRGFDWVGARVTPGVLAGLVDVDLMNWFVTLATCQAREVGSRMGPSSCHSCQPSTNDAMGGR